MQLSPVRVRRDRACGRHRRECTQNVCLLVFAFLPLPFPRSYVVLTRLPSTSTCEPFLIVVATYSASGGRKTQMRCHSVFEAHSSSAFFQERCVATERT